MVNGMTSRGMSNNRRSVSVGVACWKADVPSANRSVPAICQRDDATRTHNQITATHTVIWIDHGCDCSSPPPALLIAGAGECVGDGNVAAVAATSAKLPLG